MTKPFTEVMFRKDKIAGAKGGGIFALFPEKRGTYLDDVKIVGWGSTDVTEGSYPMQMMNSKPATPREYASLKQRIERRYGYRLKVVRRRTAR